MKKFLLGTVALVALGATVPALAADLGARAPYTKAPAYAAPIYNWTGFYIGGHVGGAFAGDNNFMASATTMTAVSSAACRAAPTTSSPPTGCSVSKASTAGSATTTTACSSRAAVVYTNNQRALGSVTGRLGYTWGPALLYVKGGYAFPTTATP